MASAPLSQPVRRGLAFLAGVGFAAVPTVGPYLAVLGVLSGRVRIQRADRWWWAAAALLGLPWLVTGHGWAGVGAIGQALAIWLIFRSASAVRTSTTSGTFPRDVGAGLLLGLVGAMALGLDRAGTWRLDTARSVFDLVAWTGSPSLYGHAMLVLAALLAVILPSPRGRVLALALGAAAVLLSGAQEAILAWLLVAIGLRFVGRRGSTATVATEWALIAIMVVVASGLTTLLGTGRAGFRVDLAPAGAANLFVATEAPAGAWWYPLGVRFEAAPGRIGDEARTVFAVEKTSADPWSRLQQIVRLEPGRTYVLSVAWRASEHARPGLDGWGRAAPDAPSANLATTWADGAWRVNASGDLEAVDVSVASAANGWMRGSVTFRNAGDAPLTWYVGMVPDRRGDIGAVTEFAELQLVAGDAPVAYVAAPPDRGLVDLRTTRLPLWSSALDAIAARPWWGWGPQGYAQATYALDPSGARQRPTAAHAHSLPLDVTVERGIVGLVGLLVLSAALALRAVQQRDRAMAVVLAAVVLLNLFDTTFLNGAVAYPLAAILGWRAVGKRPIARTQTGAASAAFVRLTLAATDAAVAVLAFTLAATITGTGPWTDALRGTSTATLAYAALLWPAFAAAVGLYPGYGRALHDELARGVRAAASASITLAALALVVPEGVPLSSRALFLVGVTTVVAAPFARMLAKLVLRAARLWGRPVALLGTGPIAARLARYLLDHPGVGLHPVAAFGDTKWDVPHLPVTGDLDRAWSAMPALGVRHAIVAPDAATRVPFDEVLRRAERSLHYIQFVPDLHGVPAASVAAAPIGTTLGLEVRNQLASRLNRALKRSFDVLGGLALLLVLGPVLLAIAAWVRLDSRGPALYLSPRVGRYGRTFQCIKFRTMHADAEDRLERLLGADPARRAEYERWHKLDGDPRVTRAGRLLRKLSLDELAQLVNVVRGDMSLVGPRPYLVRELPEMGTERDLIVLARPGITGYWQVEGRNDVTFEERQTMEAAYVRNWSVWWDVELMLRTPLAVLARRGK